MSADRPFLPYGRHRIDEADIASVVDVLRGDWLTTGPAVQGFEDALAGVTHARHAVSCSSGTAALHLAALAAGLGEGDAAVVPSLTFLATANCNRYVGSEVVFSDVDPDSGLMEATHLEAAIAGASEKNIKATYPVHMNGQCAKLEEIRAVADAHELIVIEDACHAIGTSYKPAGGEKTKIGDCTYCDMAAFSFHPVKTIAAGEAGAVTTNDNAKYGRLSSLRSHGMVREPGEFQNPALALDVDGSANPWYYEMPKLGFNYRLSDIHAALGTSQLSKLPDFARQRQSLAKCYDQLLEPMAPLVRPIKRTPGCTPIWHIYVVLIDFDRAGLSRAALMNRLREAGIGTQVHYLPVHMQPYYRERYGDIDLPGARAYYERCLSLPLFSSMTEADVEYVVESLGNELSLN